MQAASASPGGTLYVVATPIGNLADLSRARACRCSARSPRSAPRTRATRASCSRTTASSGRCSRCTNTTRTRSPASWSSGCSPAIRWRWCRTPARRWSPIRATGWCARRARRACKVSPVPGACAAIAALRWPACPATASCSKASCRRRRRRAASASRALAAEPRTLVFYESAHRIEESLADMAAVFGGERPAVLARELTKLFETVLDDTLADARARSRPTEPAHGRVRAGGRGAGDDADAGRSKANACTRS